MTMLVLLQGNQEEEITDDFGNKIVINKEYLERKRQEREKVSDSRCHPFDNIIYSFLLYFSAALAISLATCTSF